MSSKVNISIGVVLSGVLAGSISAAPPNSAQAEPWEVPAQWHRLLKKAVPGTLLLDEGGVEFRSAKFNQRWAYVDIHSFDLSRRELTLTGYQNRPRHEPGELSFHFTWSEAIPPEIAAQFTDRVGKPVRNDIPLPNVAALSEIPAHHRVWSGGSNGILRFKESGIDYVTENDRDSRSWRWTDIQTLANPNPYELRIMAYREIVEFDLKQPLARALYERMWDYLYAQDLNLSAAGREEHR